MYAWDHLKDMFYITHYFKSDVILGTSFNRGMTLLIRWFLQRFTNISFQQKMKILLPLILIILQETLLQRVHPEKQ